MRVFVLLYVENYSINYRQQQERKTKTLKMFENRQTFKVPFELNQQVSQQECSSGSFSL